MNIKIWEAQWNNNKIRVENSWSWAGETEEKILINGVVMLRRAFNAHDVSPAQATGTTFRLNYGFNDIKIIMGQTWNLLGVACRIEVNGKYVGGNRVVLFSGKEHHLSVSAKNKQRNNTPADGEDSYGGGGGGGGGD